MHPHDTDPVRRDLEQAKTALERVLLDWMEDSLIVANIAFALDAPGQRKRHVGPGTMSERMKTLGEAISLIEDLIDGLDAR